MLLQFGFLQAQPVRLFAPHGGDEILVQHGPQAIHVPGPEIQMQIDPPSRVVIFTLGKRSPGQGKPFPRRQNCQAERAAGMAAFFALDT